MARWPREGDVLVLDLGDLEGPNCDAPGGSPPQTQQQQATISNDCLEALKVAKQTPDAIARALQHVDTIRRAAANHGIDPNVVAAIGVRESGFRNIPEQGPGGGMGVFQIDRRFHPQAESFAYNIPLAADYAASLLAGRTRFYQSRGFNNELSLAGAVRDYNAGPRRTLALLQQGTISALDRGTAHGNYVSNVLAIAKHCFRL